MDHAPKNGEAATAAKEKLGARPNVHQAGIVVPGSSKKDPQKPSKDVKPSTPTNSTKTGEATTVAKEKLSARPNVHQAGIVVPGSLKKDPQKSSKDLESSTPASATKKRKGNRRKPRKNGAPATDANGQPIYPIEAILDKKLEDGTHKYLIKWEGYDEDENTWEPAENIHPKAIIDRFEEEFKKKNDKKGKPTATQKNGSEGKRRSDPDPSENDISKKVRKEKPVAAANIVQAMKELPNKLSEGSSQFHFRSKTGAATLTKDIPSDLPQPFAGKKYRVEEETTTVDKQHFSIVGLTQVDGFGLTVCLKFKDDYELVPTTVMKKHAQEALILYYESIIHPAEEGTSISD